MFWGFAIYDLLLLLGLKFEAVILGVDRKCPQMSIPVQIYAECPTGEHRKSPLIPRGYIVFNVESAWHSVFINLEMTGETKV